MIDCLGFYCALHYMPLYSWSILYTTQSLYQYDFHFSYTLKQFFSRCVLYCRKMHQTLGYVSLALHPPPPFPPHTHTIECSITINVPLILKMWEIVFWPSQISLEMAHKVIWPKTKNNIPNFRNQRFVGNFRPRVPYMGPHGGSVAITEKAEC